jgi:hypothetical protein
MLWGAWTVGQGASWDKGGPTEAAGQRAPSWTLLFLETQEICFGTTPHAAKGRQQGVTPAPSDAT